MWDAIVVGGRCAGSAVGLTLARAGKRVLIVEKATFPADTLSTLFLQPAALARLSEWGLLDPLRATGVPAMPSFALQIEDVTLSGRAWSPTPLTAYYSPRRTVLDPLLLEAAAAAGAEVRQGFVFDDVVRDGDRVTGIRGHDKSGATVTEHAAIVIGADGRSSAVARAVGAEMLVDLPGLACWYYTFYTGVPAQRGELVFRADRSVSMWPTRDGEVILVAGWPRAMWNHVKADLDASFDAMLDLAPEFADRVRAGTRAEKYYGSGELASFVRRSHGPGWALVGDAGYHKDPCTAQGIADALTYGAKLGAAIAAADGPAALDAATAAYQQERDAATREIFEFTYRTSKLEPVSPRTRLLLQAVARQPEATAQFLGVHAGTVKASAFFAPDNVAKILSA